MVHVDKLEGERRGHAQRVFVGTIEQNPASQYIIIGQYTMHILIDHVIHIDVGVVEVHTVK